MARRPRGQRPALGLLALVFAVCGALFLPRGFRDEADFAIARLCVINGATVES